MPTFSYDCPHPECLTKNSGFTSHLTKVRPSFLDTAEVFGTCNSCGRGVVFHMRLRDTQLALREAAKKGRKPAEPTQYEGPALLEVWETAKTSPVPPSMGVSHYLPKNVAMTMVDAEMNFVEGRFGAAALLYRKAIERALPAVDAEGSGKDLSTRIKGLRQKNELPSGLVDLLDRVRFLGNAAAHDHEDPAADEVELGREFTKLFFMYVFDLPKRLEAATRLRTDRKS